MKTKNDVITLAALVTVAAVGIAIALLPALATKPAEQGREPRNTGQAARPGAR